MKKFLGVLLSVVLVVMCGCSVARLYFDIIEQQNKSALNESEELTPVYTYLHSGIGALILESNSKTGEVKFIPACPYCGVYGYRNQINEKTATVTSRFLKGSETEWCSTCQKSWQYAIQVTIHVDYQ